MLAALAVFVMLLPSELCAQGLFERRMPERKLVRDGNKEFGKGDYGSSIGYYKEALERDENSFAARFNLGNAYLRDGKYKEAEETFRHIVNNNSYSDYQRAGTWYNLGKMYLEQAESEDVSGSLHLAHSLQIPSASITSRGKPCLVTSCPITSLEPVMFRSLMVPLFRCLTAANRLLSIYFILFVLSTHDYRGDAESAF